MKKEVDLFASNTEPVVVQMGLDDKSHLINNDDVEKTIQNVKVSHLSKTFLILAIIGNVMSTVAIVCDH